MNPISTITELRSRHAQGENMAGVNVRKGAITNILEENVVQPLLVSISAITLATETVRSILKIDDIVRNITSFLFEILLSKQNSNFVCFILGQHNAMNKKMDLHFAF